MVKTGRENKRYSAEFKIGVIMDMLEHHMGYRETAWTNVNKLDSKKGKLKKR